MQCDVCGTEVQPGHKFCGECGAKLRTSLPPTAAGDPGRRRFDEVTAELPVVAPAPPRDDADDPDATKVVPAVGQPMATFAPPDPTPGAGLPWSTYLGQHPGAPTNDDPTTPLAATPPPPGQFARGEFHGDAYYEPTAAQYLDTGATYSGQHAAQAQGRQDPQPWGQQREFADTDATNYVPATYGPWEGEVPWEDEAAGYADDVRRSFRLTPLMVLAVLSAAATAFGVFSNLVDVTSSRGALGGFWKVNDFGTNLAVAMLISSATMLLGTFAWGFGYRWGAGLAGGSGAGLAGLVALNLGLVELRFGAAAVNTTVTFEIGYWALAGGGVLGLVVLIVSFARAGNDRRAGLDPWVAALGAICSVVAAIGPLVPLDGSSIDENWSSPAGADFPTLFFAARFGQLALLVICGVFGFLLVRRYGLGLAIGGSLGGGWLVLTGALDATDEPIGPAFRNAGAFAQLVRADDAKPHVVTIAGVALMLFFAIVATAMALIDND